MNQVALVGNITDDPELRYTQSDAALAGFTVAISHPGRTHKSIHADAVRRVGQTSFMPHFVDRIDDTEETAALEAE
jgi:single-stranded DNA-binding protein